MTGFTAEFKKRQKTKKTRETHSKILGIAQDKREKRPKKDERITQKPKTNKNTYLRIFRRIYRQIRKLNK